MRTLIFSVALLSSTAAFAGTSPLPYKDSDFGCISQADANRYVSDFSVDLESFGGMELCNGAKDTKKLFNDLSLIEKSQFAPDVSHNLIRGLVNANDYYNWMKGETRGVQRGNDVPFATAYNQGGYFTMQDGWAALATLGRVGTVLHEARHTEGYPHYACTHGPYAGSSTAGCDTGYAQGGAHAVEMEYYTRVALDAKNLHPVYQSMARLMALGRSNFVFNDSPIKPREALLGLAGDHMVLVDGSKVIDRQTPAAASGAVLKRTSFGAALVKGTDSVAVDLYGLTNNGATISDDYSYYKLFKTPRPNAPQSVASIEEIDVGNLRYFAVLGEQGKVYSYDFPNGAWGRASSAMSGAQSFVTRAPDGTPGLYVVKSDGSVLPFNLANRSYGSALRDRWTSDTRAFAMNASTLVKLTADGRVLNSSTGAPVDAFTGKQVTDLVNVPLYDAYEVAR
ncbi:MAG: hypothetical protein ACXVB9_06590 [Bdellovibrionota bacterium]